MPNRKLIITAILLIAFTASACFLVLKFYDPHTTSEYVGFQGEASRNSFLAAEMFINKMNRNSDSHAMFDFERDASKDALIMPFMALPKGNEWESLRFMIEDGATLITGNLRGHQTNEALLTADEMNFFNLSETKILENENIIADLDIYEKSFSTDMSISNDFIIKNEVNAEAILREDDHVLAYSLLYGQGRIWVINDLSIFQNRNIADKQHAGLLWQLINDNSDTLFVFSYDYPSLLTIIWRKAPVFVILFILLIVFQIWHHAPRFGPILKQAGQHRNRLLEHIEAAAYFSFSSGGYHAILEPLQTEVREKINRSYPSYEEGLSSLAAEAGVAKEELHDIIQSTGLKNIHFIKQFNTLKKLTGLQYAQL